MALKRALVVDDSRSARFALKRMLKTLKLEVDTVESAADAMVYLEDHLPDVIFMDHMMPDMNGFEAVKRIKDNPLTAIIPIMMYTSKGGDVYLSEARALGAVGIIRKTIAPVELKSSLVELGIIDDIPYQSTLIVDKAPQKKTDTDSFQNNSAQKSNALDSYVKDLHKLMDDQTIELHRSMWLGIESVSNEIFNRLNSDFEEKIEKIQAAPEKNSISNVPFYQNKLLISVYVISALLIVSVIFNMLLLSDIEQLESQQIETNDVYLDDLVESKISIEDDVKTGFELSRDDFIRWAHNKVIEYPFDEVALNENRLSNIEELINKAIKVNFKGKIILQTHVGEFCLKSDQVGDYMLADKELSIVDCDFIGNYIQPNDGLTSHQSMGFANYLSDVDMLREQGIAIEVTSIARRLALSKYPKKTPQTTADIWNKAARLNNRITVLLEPGF